MTAIRGVLRALWAQVLAEPVYTQALVQAIIGFATAFGLKWDGVQIAATMALSAAFLAWLTHKAVTPLEQPVLPVGTAITVTTPPGQADYVATV